MRGIRIPGESGCGFLSYTLHRCCMAGREGSEVRGLEVYRSNFQCCNTNPTGAWSVTACLHIVDHMSEVLVASPGICRQDAVSRPWAANWTVDHTM